MARISLALAPLASLVFAVWFLVEENESPGMSHAVAMFVVSSALGCFAFANSRGIAITAEGRAGGWISFAIGFWGLSYILAFFTSWIFVVAAWLGLQMPLVVVLAVSSTRPDPVSLRRYRFVCPHCLTETHVAEEHIGRTGPCRRCGRMVTVRDV